MKMLKRHIVLLYQNIQMHYWQWINKPNTQLYGLMNYIIIK